MEIHKIIEKWKGSEFSSRISGLAHVMMNDEYENMKNLVNTMIKVHKGC